MNAVKKYLSLIKFSHTIFAMPFALIGFFLGWSYLKQADVAVSVVPGWHTSFIPASVDSHSLSGRLLAGEPAWRVVTIYFLLVLVCMIAARSAAMAFNRYLDRHFDAKNPRTAVRENDKRLNGFLKPFIMKVGNHCGYFQGIHSRLPAGY